ncbi:MAG: AAA family ATPase, partial [Chloroflexi bacterium]|nr:AAA family ATPase [Chloroflexota bacterium]
REPELAQLHEGFDRAMSGEGSLVMVVGEPGIGKTSLCEQLATYVGLRGGKTLVGHCYEEGSLSLPYLAFVEAMRSYVLERDPDDLKKELGSGASEVARIVSEVRDRVKVEPSAGSDPEQDRYRLLQAVVSFLRNASTVQPLMIMLEDLHDADGGTLDMLSHVARNLSGTRLLIVGTYRDVEVDRSHPLSSALAELRRGSAFGRIPLRGLTVDEVHRMLGNLTDLEIPLEASETVHRQTEGNPLFIQEVLRYLVEEGLIRGEAGGWNRTDEQSFAMSIPEGLRDVIGKRLTRLSDECNSFLGIAAVIGRDFRLDVLQQLTDMSEDDLFTVLQEATSVGVVEERAAAGAVVTYRFTHAFFRQTLYGETIAPRRIRLHQQVARVLEEVYSRRLEEHSAELAEHFSYSSDSDDLAKAVQYGEMAAERSMAVYAYGEASRLLEQALQVQEVLDPDDKARRCDLLLSLGEALLPAGEPRRVMDAVAPEAFTLAEAVSDRARASRACRIASDAIFRYGGYLMAGTPEYLQWVERADRYAEPGTTERVYADLRLRGVRWGEGKFTEARALALRAMELARKLEDPEALYSAAGRLLDQPPQHEEERLRLVREMSSHDQVGVPPIWLGLWLQIGGAVLLDWGDRAGAEAMWEQLGQHAQRTNDAGLVVKSLGARTMYAYVDGRLDEAVSGADDILRTAEELGSPVMGRQYASIASWRPLLHMGRGEEALAALGEWADLAGVDFSGVGAALEGLVRAHLGQTAEAREALQGLVADPRFGFEDENLHTRALVLLLETAILVGDRELCSVLAERLAPAANLSTALLAYTCPARHLGAAAALLGEPDKARKYYHQALEAAGKIRFRPEIALTRLQLCELLLEHYPDERAEALEHLDFAIGEFRDMKMQPSLERALSHRDILKA